MKILGWVFTGLVAAGATRLAVTTDNDNIAIVSSSLGLVSWLVFAFFSLSITIYDQTGSPHTDRYPAMAAWGLAMAAPNLYILIEGPLEKVKDRERTTREVR